MTIRFSCNCGATFEVPDDQAGLTGRCRNCGEEMTIPNVSEHADEGMDVTEVTDTARSRTPGFHDISEVPVDPQTSAHEGSEICTETIRERYCPYCGREVDHQASFCPHCLKNLRPPESPPSLHQELTPVDWFLVTALAPLGFVGGFVSLVMGNRKGLHMIGLSTATMFLTWLVFVLLGWIR
jgi:hypothetical protein